MLLMLSVCTRGCVMPTCRLLLLYCGRGRRCAASSQRTVMYDLPLHRRYFFGGEPTGYFLAHHLLPPGVVAHVVRPSLHPLNPCRLVSLLFILSDCVVVLLLPFALLW